MSKGNIELVIVAFNNEEIVSDTFTATAYRAGEINTEATLEFVSSDEQVATVTAEGGVATVTSVGEGTCDISVFYTSTYGKIETTVKVTVSRSRLAIDKVVKIPYVENNTVLDVSGLGLQGEFDGVYYAGEKISENDVINADFAVANKGAILPVEVRTSDAIYEMDLLIESTIKTAMSRY